MSIKEIPQSGILLDKGWKYKIGDNPEYANPDFDDSTWDTINPGKDIHDLPMLWKDSVVWFRLQLDVDPSKVGNLAFTLLQSGASEFYLNGKLFQRFGVIGNIPKETVAVNPLEKPFAFPVNKSGLQVLAIRYQLEPDIHYSAKWANPNLGIYIKINSVENANSYFHATRIYNQKNLSFRISSYFVLSILFLAFYVSDSKRKTSLYFFIYAAIWAIVWSMFTIGSNDNITVRLYYYWASFSLVIQVVGWIYFLTAIYELLGHEKQKIFYGIVIFGICCVPLGMLIYPWGWLVFAMGFATITNFEIVRIAFLGFLRKRRGALILAVGGVICLGFWLLFLLLNYTPVSPFLNQWFIFSLSHLTLPVAVSIFIGYDFAKTNQTLEQKLVEVKKLSEEKNQILVSQKEVLEKEVEARTHDLQTSLENLKSTQAQLIQSEKMASLGQLTAGIAHEIQNPLNFVNNFSEVSNELIDEVEVERAKSQEARDETLVSEILGEIKENLSKINHHGKRADAIVKGMLEHSRTSSGEKVPTDINALADEYLRLSYHGMRAKDKTFNAEFVTDFDPGLPKVNIVPQEIGRVMLNITNNAFYACAERSRNACNQPSERFEPLESFKPLVKVSTKNLGEKIEISVKDNGHGIPDSIKDKIFQPFFTTKPTGEGTGLGLSLSYNIVKAHGGELVVKTYSGGGGEKENDAQFPFGKGSEFIIRLPL
ncbi:MAG TPA: ATP-binding protein [Algoriphagus sp.]|nr:ATP-binding protein [Algoriphagus sp.]